MHANIRRNYTHKRKQIQQYLAFMILYKSSLIFHEFNVNPPEVRITIHKQIF